MEVSVRVKKTGIILNRNCGATLMEEGNNLISTDLEHVQGKLATEEIQELTFPVLAPCQREELALHSDEDRKHKKM